MDETAHLLLMATESQHMKQKLCLISSFIGGWHH